MGSVKKDLEKILREAEKQGWRVKPVKKGYQLFQPDGIVTVHGTPSDHHALDNIIGNMRQCGFRRKGR